jgi:hypothetical protein
MATAIQRRARSPVPVIAPLVGDVVGLFVKSNPQTPRAMTEAAARVTAALGVAATKLNPKLQRELVAHKDELPDLIASVAAMLRTGRQSRNTRREQTSAQAELNEGQGLGEQLDAVEATRRLDAYASPGRLTVWAGEVAGPAELERSYGVRRSTLHDWQKRHAVIGLLSGIRKHVFPVAQFVDGRPIEGLSQIVATAGSRRTAWLWLIEPHPSLRGQRPLDRLKAGDLTSVIVLADSDFGQQ